MTTYEIIFDAIQHKKQIFATYDGYEREFCPHNLGTKNGREQALFYQFGGFSSRGAIIPGAANNWRCIAIDGLTNVSSREGEWYTAENHGRPQSCVDVIAIEVER